MAHPIPIDTVNAMYTYYHDGHSLRETAKVFFVSSSTVHQTFVRHGYPLRTSSHSKLIKNNVRERAAAMRKEFMGGMTYREIANKWGYSIETVKWYFWRFYHPKRTVTNREIEST